MTTIGLCKKNTLFPSKSASRNTLIPSKSAPKNTLIPMKLQNVTETRRVMLGKMREKSTNLSVPIPTMGTKDASDSRGEGPVDLFVVDALARFRGAGLRAVVPFVALAAADHVGILICILHNEKKIGYAVNMILFALDFNI